MSEFAKEITLVSLEDEMQQSYLDYAMSVIIGRALPDVRDGLKPVHRRVLYAMSVLGNDWNKAYKKSARVVGDCFVKGTLVHTEHGLKPIETVKVSEKVLLANAGLSEVVEVFHNPPSEVVEVSLSNGNSLTVTLGQLFRVLNDDLSITWEKAENLQDKRVLATNSRCLGDVLSSDKDKTDLAYITGLLVAEGALADRGRTQRVTISMVDTEALEFLSQYCISHNIKVSWREVIPPNPKHSLQYCVRLTGLDEAYQSCVPTCADKFVPDWVLSDRTLFAAFIAGFTDGDGHLRLKESKREITLTSASAKLLTQIQAMLADFGIHSYYACEDFSNKSYGDNSLPRYNLWITGENASRFSHFTVDYLKTNRKHTVATEMTEWDSSHANVLSEFIPSDVIFSELSKHHLGGGWYKDKNGSKFRAGIKYPTGSKIRYSSDLISKGISYSQLEKWGIINKLERIGSPLAEQLSHLINTYSVLKVKTVVKQGKLAETYDIQIADASHEFLVEGCAVHNCIGKYHPHGDTAVYDTIVRMAQPFSLRYMLIDGQGNFGSVDGDSPAAMRYTEVRMAKIAHEMLADLDKETVDFNANYDESESEPAVLPARVPALLVNGSSGIAVGMATNIPPHNLGEVIGACLVYMDNPDIEIRDLMECIPGPDFPTAGIINGVAGIYNAYTTGRGKVHIRARSHVEDYNQGTRQAIIVTELPYQVNKARLLEKIAELIKLAKIEGISGLRDESDKDGMRMVVELRRGEVPEVVLNNLYKQTQLRTVFGINMVAINNGRPQCMNLKEILHAFINHRREVVTRRTIYLLRKARERAHVLEGLAVAMSNIDEMIALIKAAANPAEAKSGLLAKTWSAGLVASLLEHADADRSRPDGLAIEFGIHGAEYRLSEAQASAILDLRLHRLTGLEQDKIVDEYKKLLDLIDEYLEILSSAARLMEIIREELEAIKEEYADERRTEIVIDQLSLTEEDFITEEDVVVTMSHEGYVKTQRLEDYQAQRRGGRGKSASATKEEDFIEKLVVANTHDTILCFSSAGKVYWLKVYQLPIASRASRGKPFVNLLPLDKDEKISAMLTVHEYSETQFIFMATEAGTVKKTPLKEFERQRANGKIAIDLREGDKLVGVAVTDGEQNILLFSSNGKANCFSETDVRSMGRTATGVRGMRLVEGQKIISLITSSEGTVLNVTENGYGKRTRLEEFTRHKRGGQGMIAMQTSERNGNLVGAVLVADHDEIMLISDGGILVRTKVNEISVVGRNTQGVKVIRLDSKEKLIGVDKIDGLVETESEDETLQGENNVDEQAKETDELAGESLEKLDPDMGESE